MKTLLVYTPRYLEHDTGWGHPERAERLNAIIDGLERAGLWDSPSTPVRQPKPAKVGDVRAVHSAEYVELVRRLSASEIPIDGDTPTRKQTYELALLSAGGAIEGARAAWRGEVQNSFALVRPPGHHALRSAGGGFCYFNNIAIAIRKIQQEFGLKRTLILDFDAHHGNGTQDIFFEDPEVFYISFHQSPLYTGTGRVDEIGVGEGEGFTANVPMLPESGDAEYRTAIEDVFVPLAEQFKPEFIAVSAGFDAHQRDPLTSLLLSSEMYGWMMGVVCDVAGRLCKHRVLVVLEGGYDLQALGESATYMVKAMQGERFDAPKKRKAPPSIERLKHALREYWEL